MSNPFDQFGSELQAALPPAPPVAEPPAAPFGAPPPMHDQQPGMYGAPPPDASSNPYGMPPQQQQQQPPMMMAGKNAYGAPPPQDANPYGAPPPPAQDANPYGAPPPQDSNPYGAPPPPPAQDANPYGAPPPSQESNPYGAPAPDANPYGAPAPDANPYGAPAPDANPYGAPPPSQEARAPPEAAPYGAPPSNPYGAPPPESQPPAAPDNQPPQADPNAYADPWQQPSANDPNANALVPSQQQSNPYAYGAPPPQDQQNPYGQQMVPANPYGAPPPQPAFLGYGHPAYGAPPQPPAPVDPFSVFEKPEPPAPEPAVEAVSAGPDPNAPDDDFWGSFGNNNAEAEAPVAAAPKESVVEPQEEEKKGEEGLPPGGEWYDARIFTPTLGVMFFKPQELTDSLFLNTDKEIVEGLGERPVVAFIVEGSSARSAGVELGHVLLKVNGVDVRSPKEASRLIKEGPRPLPLLFYVPSTEVVIAEGEHMVKYDTKETVAPNSAKDWKPKYVVIGGIIAQPWMMNMYRSKVRFVCAFFVLCFCLYWMLLTSLSRISQSEYDIAVIETQARRPVSVKVKQFSLQGARIQNDWQGPQMVKYKNKLHPWKYIVVLPVARNPIKISSPNLSQLKPVHEGIRRVLLAQQRGGRGGRSSSQREVARSDGGHSDGHRPPPQHGGHDNYSRPQQPAYAQASSYRY